MEASGRSEDQANTQPASHDVERHLRTLQAARLLHSTLDLKQLTAIILEIVRNEVPVDRVTAFVVDRKHGLLHSVVAQGVEGITISMPITKGIAGFVALNRQALDITAPYVDPRFNPEFDRRLNYRTNDIFAMPVLNNSGDVVGVLELINRKETITPGDIEFLQDISVFIGLALENAWLHEQVRDKTLIEDEVAAFLNFIQKPAGGRSKVDVKELVRQAIALRATHWSLEGILLTEELDTTPPILANVAELQHAILNVIRNAEEATADKEGPRRLTIRTMYEPGLKFVRIDIVDNGVGIPTQHYERVFEPFFSTKREKGRTGLGLTIANRIIREHEGELLFETRPGQGTIFTIELPAGPR
jgi:signal transduction histidine kinase